MADVGKEEGECTWLPQKKSNENKEKKATRTATNKQVNDKIEMNDEKKVAKTVTRSNAKRE